MVVRPTPSYVRSMVTLHIEHLITDYDTWRAAFDGFAEVRRANGVVGERVARPVGDRAAIVIDLDFDRPDEAAAFLDFLRTSVWSTATAAPALVGAPRATILEPVPTAAG